MKCLNTRGGCDKEAVYVKELDCSNFCSIDCCLIYNGKREPPVPERKKFDDPERQLIHDLYLWALTGVYPRKPYVEPLKRGAKSGTKRGPYKKSGKKKHTFVCKGCGRTFTIESKKRLQDHSDACRRRHWRDKKKQKDADERRNRQY